MSTTAYVNRLRESRTFKTGVIEDIEEYVYRVRLGGLFRTLPPLPQANSDRHVVVIEITGNQPSVFSVLTRMNHTINPTSRDVDQLVFIFLSVKPKRLTIQSPPDGYLLSDGQRIKADIELAFCVNNVEQFWNSATDPIANLEAQIINEAKKYFSRLNSASLINTLDISQRKLEQQIMDSQLSVIMDGLQSEIRNTSLKDKGVSVDEVHASIELTPQLQDFFDRRRNELLNRGGIMDRHDVDTRIDRDRTFEPYKLRDLIMAVDSRLLENFYSMPYSDAMRLVHESVARARQAYLEKKNNEEIDRLSRLIEVAQTRGLDDLQVSVLKDKLADRLLSMADSSPSDESQSNQDYVRHLLGGGKPQNQLGDTSSATTKTGD